MVGIRRPHEHCVSEMLRAKIRERVDVLLHRFCILEFSLAQRALQARVIRAVRALNELFVFPCAAVLKDRDAERFTIGRHLRDIGLYYGNLNLEKDLRGTLYDDLAVGLAVNLFRSELGE